MTLKLIACLFVIGSTFGGIFLGFQTHAIQAIRGTLPEPSLIQEPQSAPSENSNAIAGISVETAPAKITASFSNSEWLATSKTTLGVHVGSVSDALRKHLQIPNGTGLLVEHVVKGSGAAKSALRRYDVLYQLDDQILVNAEQLSVLVEMRKAGSKVKLKVIRDGREIELEAVLQSKNTAKGNRQFDAFHFFHGHAGRSEFQNCSVCHKSDSLDGNTQESPHGYDNYKFFHGESGKAEFQKCSTCHTKVVYPLNISGAR